MKFKWLYYSTAMVANVAIGVFVWNTLTVAQPTTVAEVKSTHIAANIPTNVKELKCLADNIYFESLIEPVAGQIAVANVTMNRVNSPHFPNTVCEVVWQKKQFSWTHDGKSDVPSEKVLWFEVYNIAEKVYNGEISDITEGSTFYHADYVNPSWASKMDRKVVKIGRHIFYWNKDLS